MTSRVQTLLTTLTVVMLLTIPLSACQQAETVEVTRVEIMERRVIEYVEVTVPVTRIHRVVETPRPTDDAVAPQISPSPPPPPLDTPAPTAAPIANPVETAPAPSSARETGESMLAAVRDMEQTLLALVQDLNSDPLPGAHILGLYAAIRAAPTLAIPEDEGELLSIYARYREQVDYVLDQATDLHAHLAAIESGEANQTEVSTIHLALARDAASASTSTVQGLARELETYLASQP